MSERQLLDLLAQEAPDPRPGLADDVIGRARHNRLRRWAVSGACAAVALIAAVPLSVAINSSSPHSADRLSPGTHTANSTSTNPPAAARSADAQAYAAGVRYLAEQLVPGKRWRVLFVLEHTCVNTVSLTGPCDPRPIPAALRRDLAAALRPYAAVQFVSDGAKITAKNLQVINEGVAVTLGRMALTGDTGRLQLSVRCGGLCGLGETLLLARHDGVWTVTGSTGPSWIS